MSWQIIIFSNQGGQETIQGTTQRTTVIPLSKVVDLTCYDVEVFSYNFKDGCISF